MLSNKRRFFYAISFLSSTLLVACGGSGGSAYKSPGGTSSSDGYGMPSSSAAASSVTSSTAVSSAASSAASSQATTAISVFTTTRGSAFVGTGMVTVLSPSGVAQQDKTNFSLYTFDTDTPGVSHCTSVSCVTNWPPLIASSTDVAVTPFTIITRTDGNRQWALRDMPLYFYVGDSAAGDVTGEGVGGVWFLARVPPVVSQQNSSKGVLFIAHGNILNSAGSADNSHANFTLYTFDSDALGASSCNGGCLVNWPALYAPMDAQNFGDFTVITRSTGEKQWAYKGKALYFYKNDVNAGDTLGEYSGWTIARP